MATQEITDFYVTLIKLCYVYLNLMERLFCYYTVGISSIFDTLGYFRVTLVYSEIPSVSNLAIKTGGK